jgi:chemotaxis protein CheY-P-specific phosphatase CheC
MSESTPSWSNPDLDRLRELCGVGASCAARAFEQILGLEVEAGASHVVFTEDTPADERWDTAVLFEADGEMAGMVAILLTEPSRDAIGTLLLGGENGRDLHAVESALREVGNIIASHTVSAMADALSVRILLSVPTLVMSDASTVLAERIRERGAAICIASPLRGEGGELDARLVFIPESKPTA